MGGTRKSRRSCEGFAQETLMTSKKKLNIGLVGYGFMGRTHSNAFLQAPRFFDVPYEPVLKAVCARNADRVKAFAANWGYENAVTDWRALINRKDIDLIDIASPNDTHAEIAIAAAQAGKMVMCEKPLGRNGAEAEKMVAAVEKARVPNSVWYNYRRVPAVTLAKQLVDAGKLGRIFHYRAQFLQDWTVWQVEKVIHLRERVGMRAAHESIAHHPDVDVLHLSSIHAHGVPRS